jgi:hypothetical protein
MNSEVHYFLPLSPYARKRMRASDHEIMAGYSWRLTTEPDAPEKRPASIAEE